MKITKQLTLVDDVYCVPGGQNVLCELYVNRIFNLKSPKKIQVTIADHRMHRSKVVKVYGYYQWVDPAKTIRPLHITCSLYLMRLIPLKNSRGFHKVHVSVKECP